MPTSGRRGKRQVPRGPPAGAGGPSRVPAPHGPRQVQMGTHRPVATRGSAQLGYVVGQLRSSVIIVREQARPPGRDRVADVRFHINWQWPAIDMQYERLIERSQLSPDRMLTEHMRMVADMDFLVTAVRRFLRTAAVARQIPSENQQELKLALRVFNSRWGNLTPVRDALEHSDTAANFPVPAVATTVTGNGENEFTFMWPGGNLHLTKLYEDSRSVLKAMLGVIQPFELTSLNP
jgi:hypothetical protein